MPQLSKKQLFSVLCTVRRKNKETLLNFNVLQSGTQVFCGGGSLRQCVIKFKDDLAWSRES